MPPRVPSMRPAPEPIVMPNPSLSKPIPRQESIALAIALQMERQGRLARPGRTNAFADAPVDALRRSRGLRGGV